MNIISRWFDSYHKGCAKTWRCCCCCVSGLICEAVGTERLNAVGTLGRRRLCDRGVVAELAWSHCCARRRRACAAGRTEIVQMVFTRRRMTLLQGLGGGAAALLALVHGCVAAENSWMCATPTRRQQDGIRIRLAARVVGLMGLSAARHDNKKQPRSHINTPKTNPRKKNGSKNLPRIMESVRGRRGVRE